jgi:hypothetical protein
VTEDLHRQLAARLFTDTWRMMELEDRDPDEDAAMLHQAHAALYHWLQVGSHEHTTRGEWQCSRVYSLLGRPEPALYHARRALDACLRHGIGDWDLGYAYEAMARAYAVAGRVAAAGEWLDRARAAAADIAEDDDRELLLDDLATVEKEILSYAGG